MNLTEKEQEVLDFVREKQDEEAFNAIKMVDMRACRFGYRWQSMHQRNFRRN